MSWGLYWDKGKENGNYCSRIGFMLGVLVGGIMEKKMEATNEGLGL